MDLGVGSLRRVAYFAPGGTIVHVLRSLYAAAWLFDVIASMARSVRSREVQIMSCSSAGKCRCLEVWGGYRGGQGSETRLTHIHSGCFTGTYTLWDDCLFELEIETVDNSLVSFDDVDCLLQCVMLFHHRSLGRQNPG